MVVTPEETAICLLIASLVGPPRQDLGWGVNFNGRHVSGWLPARLHCTSERLALPAHARAARLLQQHAATLHGPRRLLASALRPRLCASSPPCFYGRSRCAAGRAAWGGGA